MPAEGGVTLTLSRWDPSFAGGCQRPRPPPPTQPDLIPSETPSRRPWSSLVCPSILSLLAELSRDLPGSSWYSSYVGELTAAHC